MDDERERINAVVSRKLREAVAEIRHVAPDLCGGCPYHNGGCRVTAEGLPWERCPLAVVGARRAA